MQQKKWSLEKKLEKDIELHNELHQNYLLISKLVIVLQRKQIPVIIENPYSSQHYLINYWCIKPSIIDKNRHATGDFFEKPTSYWFIGIEPKNNFIFEAVNYKKKMTVNGLYGTKDCQVQRSMISPDYINRFIREYIIDGEEKKPLSDEKQLIGQPTIFDFMEDN